MTLGEDSVRALRQLAAMERPTVTLFPETLNAFLDEYERLRAHNTELMAVLRSVEWSGDTGDDRWNSCPRCEGRQPTHAPDCTLDAALRANGE